jgi:hypothetical protein
MSETLFPQISSSRIDDLKFRNRPLRERRLPKQKILGIIVAFNAAAYSQFRTVCPKKIAVSTERLPDLP